MNQAFRDFLALPEQERRDIFDATSDALDTVSSYVEKDFWVCLVLDILYNGLPSEHPRILFKGGTSLSKVHGLISRFSEDVDLTIFLEDLGFTKDIEQISRKQQAKQSDLIRTAASNYICNNLKVDLATIATSFSTECSISIDSEDSDQSTLLFQYPSLFAEDGYIQPRVKLEGGGRSALDPHDVHTIKPFIDSILTSWSFDISSVITISPERTFWDKVMILHGWYCGNRDEARLPDDRQRLSRHYYDVAMIYKDPIGKSAVKNAALGEDVRRHTIRYFNRAWQKLDEAVPGSLHLTPGTQLQKALQADYQKMQGMMMGEAPKFEEILAVLNTIETQINNQQ